MKAIAGAGNGEKCFLKESPTSMTVQNQVMLMAFGSWDDCKGDEASYWDLVPARWSVSNGG